MVTKEEMLVQDIYSGNLILTKELMEKLEKAQTEQQEKIQNRLRHIQEGASFGERYDFDSYCPARLIRVTDEEKGIIEYEEISISKVSTASVLHLFVDDMSLADSDK